MVIAASLSLADIPGTVRLYRLRRTEFLLSIAAFLGVVLLGVLPGIAHRGRALDRQRVPPGVVAVPDGARAGAGDPGLPRRAQLPGGRAAAGCVIFRFDAPLFFANARTFREQVRALATAEPRPRWIIVAAEPITDVDTTAADMLRDLDEDLNANGISLVFAEMKDPVRRKIERYELTETIDPAHFFPTIEAAVAAFQKETGADWGPAPARRRSEPQAPSERDVARDRARPVCLLTASLGVRHRRSGTLPDEGVGSDASPRARRPLHGHDLQAQRLDQRQYILHPAVAGDLTADHGLARYLGDLHTEKCVACSLWQPTHDPEFVSSFRHGLPILAFVSCPFPSCST